MSLRLYFIVYFTPHFTEGIIRLDLYATLNPTHCEHPSLNRVSGRTPLEYHRVLIKHNDENV